MHAHHVEGSLCLKITYGFFHLSPLFWIFLLKCYPSIRCGHPGGNHTQVSGEQNMWSSRYRSGGAGVVLKARPSNAVSCGSGALVTRAFLGHSAERWRGKVFFGVIYKCDGFSSFGCEEGLCSAVEANICCTQVTHDFPTRLTQCAVHVAFSRC